MTHAYKISRLPKDYCTLAVAAWKVLSDCELFEIEGKLVFTDDFDAFIEKENPERFCAYESRTRKRNSSPTRPPTCAILRPRAI